MSITAFVLNRLKATEALRLRAVPSLPPVAMALARTPGHHSGEDLESRLQGIIGHRGWRSHVIRGLHAGFWASGSPQSS